jgi:hypothetical protein
MEKTNHLKLILLKVISKRNISTLTETMPPVSQLHRPMWARKSARISPGNRLTPVRHLKPLWASISYHNPSGPIQSRNRRLLLKLNPRLSNLGSIPSPLPLKMIPGPLL